MERLLGIKLGCKCCDPPKKSCFIRQQFCFVFFPAAKCAFTVDEDVDGRLLAAGPLQANVAAHVNGQRAVHVQGRRALRAPLAPHLGPLLPLPLDFLLALAAQVKGRVERDHQVGSRGGDAGLAVACETDRKRRIMSTFIR